MKSKILIPAALLMLLCATAQAQFTYAGGDLNKTMTYDGLGVDSGLNPYTVAGTGDDYIGHNAGGVGVLTVLSGTLTLNCDDFKIGASASTGTILMGAGATLNVNLIGQYDASIDNDTGAHGFLVISNGATVNFYEAGTSDQSLTMGANGRGVNPDYGQVDVNGGTWNITSSGVLRDSAGFFIGGGDGWGTINLNAGAINDMMPLPFVLGGNVSALTTTPVFAAGTAPSPRTNYINILNGSLVMTAICPQTDTNKATFVVMTNDNGSYVNFIPGGTGSLSLTNWAIADYNKLVTNGLIRIVGTAATMGSFQYTNSHGQGVLKVNPVVLVAFPITPSNVVFAATPVTLSGAAYGSGVAGASFQWQTDGGSGGIHWTNISGATSTNYLLATTNLVGNYDYQLVAASGGNNYTSAIVALTVLPATPPIINQDVTPAGTLTLYVGEGVSWSASFTGSQPISYNWQVSADGFTFTNIPNATNTTFTIPSINLGNAGYYALMASNQFGTTTAYGASANTYLNAVTGPPFPTYLWGASIPFSTLNADQILTNFPGTKVAGALVAKNGGSPIIVTNSSADSPIQFAGSGAWATLSGGAGYTTAANINTNQTGNTNFNTCLGDAYDNTTPLITMSGLVVGQQYQVQLFGLDNRSGLSPAASARIATWSDPNNANDTSQSFAMSASVYMLATFTATNSVMAIQENLLNTSSGNFNCLVLRAVGWNPPPYITSQPANVNGFLGTRASLSSSAAGDPTIPNPAVIYQWAAGPTNGPFTNLVAGAKYAITSSPTNSTLTISNLTFSDGIPSYVLIASNGGGSTTSRVAFVYVQAAPVPPAPGSYGAFALSNNPIGYWRLNETNDPSTGLLGAYDFSGNGNTGTYGVGARNGFNGIVGPTNYPGFAANVGALSVAGNGNQTVLIPALLTTPVTGYNCTIALWINPTIVNSTFRGIFYDRNSDTYGMNFGPSTVNGLNVLGYTWNNNQAATYNYNSGLTMPLNTWQFCVVVIESNKATLYHDYLTNGVPVLESAVNNTTATASLIESFATGVTAIGGDPGNGSTITAYIADVGLYNTNLSSDQVLKMFGAAVGVPGFAPQISGLPAGDIYYPAPLASGRTLSLSTTANGTAPLGGYQWMFNGAPLTNGAYLGATVTGANSNNLNIANLTISNMGAYKLIVTNVVGAATSSVVNVSILPATMVGQWLSVSNSLADASGYSPAGIHDATVVAGSTYWTNDVPAVAPPGSASLYFNAAGLRIANSATTDAGYTNTFDNQIYNGLTVMCWAKGLPNGIWRTFVAKNGENNGWQIRVSSPTNKPTWTLREGNADMQAITLPLSFFTNANAWHHYAGTYSPVTGVRSLYVDGVLIASQTGETAYPSALVYHLTIGQEEQASGIGDGPYTGAMYDVRVYDYALDQSGIASIVGLPEARTQYAVPGAIAKFGTVGINAAPPYSGYRWQINGANLSDGAYLGATISGSGTLSLTVSNITVNNAGLYQLLVTNTAGVTTSSIVKLTVLPATKVGQWLTGGAQSLADVSGFSPAGRHDAVVQTNSVIWTNDVPASAPPGSYSLYFNNAGLIISNSSALMDANYTNTFDDEIYGDMTVMCWAKGFPGTWNPWVSKDGDGGNSLPNNGWQLRMNNNGPNSAWTLRGTGGNEDLTSSIASVNNQWIHYAGTYSSSTGVRSLYVDGVLAATETGQGPYVPTRASHLMIGAKDNGTGISFGNYLTGKIYDVRVYNYALTKDQIASEVPGITQTGLMPTMTRQIFPGVSGNIGGQLVLTWNFGTLLNSTNVAGPWTPVPGATSPYTNIMTVNPPDVFFILSNP